MEPPGTLKQFVIALIAPSSGDGPTRDRRGLFRRLLPVLAMGACCGFLSGVVNGSLALATHGAKAVSLGGLLLAVALTPVACVYWWALGLGFARSIAWARSTGTAPWVAGVVGAGLGAILWGGGAILFFGGLEDLNCRLGGA